jgi:hypothetical protein
MSSRTPSPYLGGLGFDLPHGRSGSDVGGQTLSAAGSRNHSPAAHSRHASNETLLQPDNLHVLGQNVAETNPTLRERIRIENPTNAVDSQIGMCFI